MNCKYLFTAAFLLFSLSISIAQNANANRISLHNEYRSKQYNDKTSVSTFFSQLPSSLRSVKVEFEEKSVKEENGRKHIKYQQKYEGKKIIGAEYHLHLKGDFIYYSNGHLFTEVILDNSISMTIDDVKDKILDDPMYYFYNYYDSPNLSPQFEDGGSLVLIDRLFPAYSGKLRHAYQLKVSDKEHILHSTIYVDAENGKLIFEDQHVCTHAVPGKGESYYYGEVDFTCDSVDVDEFVLRDPSRGLDGINVYNDRTDDLYSSQNSTFDLSKDNLDVAAIDAIYCTTKFYDLMKHRFDWLGLDGNDLSMNCVINVRSNSEYVNAFWNGDKAHFGNGSCEQGPLTSLSIVGHEFMHGITDYTSDLIYFDESGAINESLSDIFGKYLEAIEDPENFSWEVDKKISLSADSEPFRSMSNPNLYEDPDTYEGDFWKAKSGRFSDNSYVHSHSGVLNYWFYLLSEGGISINDVGMFFSVPAIGMDDAINILWNCQLLYLNSTSQYRDLAAYSLVVASDLYGENSNVYEAIEEAWKAVNVIPDYDPEVNDLAIEIISTNEICISDNNFGLDVQISNIGNTTWESGTPITIDYNVFNLVSSITVIIPHDLMPGDSFDEYLFLETTDIDFEAKTFIVELLINDEKDDVHANNSSLIIGRYFYNIQPLLTLTNAEIVAPCTSSNYSFEFMVENNACNPIENETTILFEVFDSSSTVVPIYTKEITLDGIEGKESLFFSEQIELDADIGKMRYAAINGQFVHWESSRIAISQPTLVAVKNEGLIRDFESGIGLDEWTFLAKTKTIDFNTFLIHTSENVFERDFSCKSAEIIFEQSSPFFRNSNYWFSCVDFSQMEKPILSFDTKFYRSDELDTELSSMIMVTYMSEDDQYTDIIKGIEEGEWKYFEYDLPSNFVGEITIELFTQQESENLFGTPDHDAIYFDNLFLGSSEQTATKDDVVEVINIYPNPVLDLLMIDSDVIFDRFIIFNSQGKKMTSGSYGRTIETEKLNRGFYSLILYKEDRQVGVGKFVK